MKSSGVQSLIDHHLIARVQACVNGANAHDVHALLGIYFGLCAVGPEDPVCAQRIASVERRLRALCVASALAEPPAATRLPRMEFACAPIRFA